MIKSEPQLGGSPLILLSFFFDTLIFILLPQWISHWEVLLHLHFSDRSKNFKWVCVDSCKQPYLPCSNFDCFKWPPDICIPLSLFNSLLVIFYSALIKKGCKNTSSNIMPEISLAFPTAQKLICPQITLHLQMTAGLQDACCLCCKLWAKAYCSDLVWWTMLLDTQPFSFANWSFCLVAMKVDTSNFLECFRWQQGM